MDLTIGGYRYDTTRALFDGTVTIDGANTSMRTAQTLPEIFTRLLAGHEFDAGELGMTFYLRSLADDPQYIALPVFPNRLFRHSSIFVNKNSHITEPKDLAGKTIGEFGVFGQDPGVWIKGILGDDYGWRPEQSRWIIGGLEQPMPPFEFTTHPHPAAVDVTVAPADKALAPMLESGEIDALFTANVPQRVQDGSPAITRLFPDYEPIERDYYRRTGIFPFMHPIVVRRSLLRDRPDLVRNIYQAYLQAKDIAADGYRQARKLYQVPTMLPWTNALFERNEQLFGADWWPYGVEANRPAIEAFLRYHYEQGLSDRLWAVEDVFACLDT